jgi:penicillin-binding protein 1C
MLIPGLDPRRQRIPLEAQAIGETRGLSWFVDGALVGETHPDERLWWTPSLGRHEIYVLDEGGLSARHVVEVRERPQ